MGMPLNEIEDWIVGSDSLELIRDLVDRVARSLGPIESGGEWDWFSRIEETFTCPPALLQIIESNTILSSEEAKELGRKLNLDVIKRTILALYAMDPGNFPAIHSLNAAFSAVTYSANDLPWDIWQRLISALPSSTADPGAVVDEAADALVRQLLKPVSTEANIEDFSVEVKPPDQKPPAFGDVSLDLCKEISELHADVYEHLFEEQLQGFRWLLGMRGISKFGNATFRDIEWRVLTEDGSPLVESVQASGGGVSIDLRLPAVEVLFDWKFRPTVSAATILVFIAGGPAAVAGLFAGGDGKLTISDLHFRASVGTTLNLVPVAHEDTDLKVEFFNVGNPLSLPWVMLGDPSKLSIAIVGDIKHSRVAKSLSEVLAKYEVKDLRFVGPAELLPNSDQFPGVRRESALAAGIEGADVVMALRLQKERFAQLSDIPDSHEYFRRFGLTAERSMFADPDAIVMHPGPMNRGVEIDSEVADRPQAVIREQVTTGLAVRMAVLSIVNKHVKANQKHGQAS
jgi:hypothetical protein